MIRRRCLTIVGYLNAFPNHFNTAKLGLKLNKEVQVKHENNLSQANELNTKTKPVPELLTYNSVHFFLFFFIFFSS